MDPIRRNANRMLDTLTGKIPEKLSQDNGFEPLPTLEEMDGTNGSSSIAESIQNNWVAILAALLLIMFTVFNVLAYYLKEKGESTDTTKKMFKSFDDAYKYAQDSFAKVEKFFTGEKEEEELKELEKEEKKEEEEPITTTNPVVATALSNQMPNITAGPPVGKPIVKNQVRKNINRSDDDGEWEEEEEDPNKAINALDTALANASQKKDDDSSYKANDAYSSVQTVKAKAGWCFVGEERGFRNCVEVGENDKCLSGDIFPTSQVCVNPRLRA